MTTQLMQLHTRHPAPRGGSSAAGALVSFVTEHYLALPLGGLRLDLGEPVAAKLFRVRATAVIPGQRDRHGAVLRSRRAGNRRRDHARRGAPQWRRWTLPSSRPRAVWQAPPSYTAASSTGSWSRPPYRMAGRRGLRHRVRGNSSSRASSAGTRRCAFLLVMAIASNTMAFWRSPRPSTSATRAGGTALMIAALGLATFLRHRGCTYSGRMSGLPAAVVAGAVPRGIPSGPRAGSHRALPAAHAARPRASVR